MVGGYYDGSVEVLNGDTYGGTIVDGGQVIDGTATQPMTTIPAN